MTVVEVLKNPTEEKPYLIGDYPAGYKKRCQKLVWVGKQKVGEKYSMFWQTTNVDRESHKTVKYRQEHVLFHHAISEECAEEVHEDDKGAFVYWYRLNKPKKVTGSLLVALYINEKGHIKHSSLNFTRDAKESFEWCKQFQEAWYDNADMCSAVFAGVAQAAFYYSQERKWGNSTQTFPATVTPAEKEEMLDYAKNVALARFKELTDEPEHQEEEAPQVSMF